MPKVQIRWEFAVDSAAFQPVLIKKVLQKENLFFFLANANVSSFESQNLFRVMELLKHCEVLNGR